MRVDPLGSLAHTKRETMNDTSPSPLPIGPRGRLEAAAAVWSWQRGDGSVARARTLRRQGWLQAGVGYLATVGLYLLGQPALAAVAGGLAVLTAALATLSPLSGYTRLRGALTRFGRGAGVLVSWVVLLPVFFAFFVPFGLMLRRGASDTMKRTLDPSAPSYWQTVGSEANVLSRQERQF